MFLVDEARSANLVEPVASSYTSSLVEKDDGNLTVHGEKQGRLFLYTCKLCS